MATQFEAASPTVLNVSKSYLPWFSFDFFEQEGVGVVVRE
jgi:hypothetical protein